MNIYLFRHGHEESKEKAKSGTLVRLLPTKDTGQ